MMKYKALFVFIAFGCIISGCKGRKYDFGKINGSTQGSTYSIVFESSNKIKPEKLKQDVEKIFHDFDMSLSIYNDSSIISKVNRNEEPIVDSFFLDIISKSNAVSLMTDGAFDITVGPLVKAWGFGPDANKNFDVSKLDSLKKLVGFRKISVKDNHLIKSDPGIFLDVNAIAPGYSVDVICRYLKGLGMKNYLVEIGGEVKAVGTKNGADWRIGIDRPEDNNMVPGDKLQAIIKIRNRALATSGNYRKYYIENGVKYAHHINPETGYPTKNTLLSISIIADDCASADGIATACMVMGKEKTIEFLTNNPELEAFMVYSDEEGNFRTWITENLRNNITENSAN
jgi:thiamine biosynthesis lipoprotein